MINVRLVLNRSIVLLAGFAIFYIAAGALELAFHERVAHLPGIVALIGAIIFILAHERLRGATDVVDWLFYHRRYIAERDLKKAEESLAHVTQIERVNHTLIDLPTNALDITAAGLFERQSDESFHRVHATALWPQTLLPAIPPDHPLLSALKDVPLMVPDHYWEDSMPASHPVQLPVLAIPIVIGRILSRIALFGPHTNDEAIDRDELNIIRRMAKSASLAYATLEAEEAERLRLGTGG